MTTAATATAKAGGGPLSRKGQTTRARLLTAARRVFEEVGFLSARVVDIAERAGVAHGSFYHYFDSKDIIFREIAEAQEQLLTSPPDDADAPPDETALDRLRRANRRYFERYRENARIMAVVEEVSRYDTHVNEARIRLQKHFADRAETTIKRLQADGKADPEIDPQLAAVALGSMVGRFAELWLIEEWADYEFEHAVDQISRLWANAIGLSPAGVKRKR